MFRKSRRGGCCLLHRNREHRSGTATRKPWPDALRRPFGASSSAPVAPSPNRRFWESFREQNFAWAPKPKNVVFLPSRTTTGEPYFVPLGVDEAGGGWVVFIKKRGPGRFGNFWFRVLFGKLGVWVDGSFPNSTRTAWTTVGPPPQTLWRAAFPRRKGWSSDVGPTNPHFL